MLAGRGEAGKVPYLDKHEKNCYNFVWFTCVICPVMIPTHPNMPYAAGGSLP